MFEFGLGSMGATLAARYPAPFQDEVVTNLRRENGAYWQAHLPTLEWEPYSGIWALPFEGHPAFPFGVLVLPDEHT